MKLANIMYQGMQRIALADGQNLAVLDSDAPPTVELARNPDSAAQCNVIATIPIEEAEFLQPVLRPGKIICVGVNYHAHAAEGGGRQQDPAYPSLFVRFPESQVAHGGEIPMPSVSEQLDFEGELAVVIGQAAWRVSVEQAGKHILGYSCFAENAVRDFQRHSGQATAGKNFLHSGAFGPWLVTPDEVGPLASLNLRTRERLFFEVCLDPVSYLIGYIDRRNGSSSFIHSQAGPCKFSIVTPHPIRAVPGAPGPGSRFGGSWGCRSGSRWCWAAVSDRAYCARPDR